MEPALPEAAALSIAGDRIAGGVGTHEAALPTPERVDLGGYTLLPGFTDSHVHFLLWSLRQEEVRLEGAASLEDALARVRDAVPAAQPGRWIRGAGWRSGVYREVAADPVRPTWAERSANPRARSAKLRWACRSDLG